MQKSIGNLFNFNRKYGYFMLFSIWTVSESFSYFKNFLSILVSTLIHKFAQFWNDLRSILKCPFILNIVVHFFPQLSFDQLTNYIKEIANLSIIYYCHLLFKVFKALLSYHDIQFTHMYKYIEHFSQNFGTMERINYQI